MSVNKTSRNKKSGVEIRRANPIELDFIIRIIQESYPEFINYRVPIKYINKWLSKLLSINCAEIYCLCEGSEIVGSYIIVLDVEAYTREREKNKPPFWIRLISLLKNYRLWSFVLRQKYHLLYNKLNRRHDHESCEMEKKWSDSITISQLSVSKKTRRNGYGRLMLNHIEERTKLLDRGQIILSVRKNNKEAIELYESSGYSRCYENKEWFEYRKKLRT
jgi:ribosomal protein S18 acetylase RimI-like enzyme